MKKMLATVTTVALSLAMVALPSLGATADEVDPQPVESTVVETLTETIPEEPPAEEPPTENPSTEDPPATFSEPTALSLTAAPRSTPNGNENAAKNGAGTTGNATLCTDIAGGPGWTPKVDTVGDPATVPYKAPPGSLVDMYCVKAGPTAIIVVVDPPLAELELDYPDKDSVSHWMVHLIPKPEECHEYTVKTDSGECDPPVEDCEEQTHALSIQTEPVDCVIEPKLIPTHETCVAGDGGAPGTKVNGAIQIVFEQGSSDHIEKIEYTLKGANDWMTVAGTTIPNLPPGTYEVRFTPVEGYEVVGSNPLEVTIDGTKSDDCKKIVICHWTQGGQGDLGKWESIEISVNAVKNAGHYDPPSPNSTHNFDIIPPFDGNTGKNWNAASSYLAPDAFDQYPFLGSTGAQLWPDCATPDVPVTITWEKENQQCVAGKEGAPGTLVGGAIELFFDPDADGIEKIEYRKVGDLPWLEYSSALTGLAPGDYQFVVTPKDGYDADPLEFTITIVPDHSLDCMQLPDKPIVEAWASFVQLTCTADGSYTFGATPAEEGEPTPTVFFTVNGNPADAGSYPVTGAMEVTIEAAANGPDYGFAEGQQTKWTFTFTEPAACGDLPTLALTGGDPSSSIAVAGFLALLGAALIRVTARGRRVTED